MTSREIFEQAREAALRIRDIGVRAEIMQERIGIHGRSSDAVMATALDPMRKVDDLIDWELEEYRTAVASSREAIADADALVAGTVALGFVDAARTLRLYYIEAWTLNDVARAVGHQLLVVSMMLESATRWIDETGIAKVKEAGR